MFLFLGNRGYECLQAPYFAGAQLAHFAEQGVVQTIFGPPGLLLYGALDRLFCFFFWGGQIWGKVAETLGFVFRPPHQKQGRYSGFPKRWFIYLDHFGPPYVYRHLRFVQPIIYSETTVGLIVVIVYWPLLNEL